MHRFRTLLTVIGAVTVLLLAGNTVAYAATGGKFFLGKVNKANKQSVLKRTTSGPALKLTTKSATNAPLTVNGRGKVGNLNADLLDGLDSSSLRTGTYVFTKAVPEASAATSLDLPIPLPPGTYLLGYSAYVAGAGLDGDDMGCRFERRQGGTTTISGHQEVPTRTGNTPGVSGNSVVTVGGGATVNLYCYAAGAFHTGTDEPIQITATRTSVLGGGSL